MIRMGKKYCLSIVTESLCEKIGPLKVELTEYNRLNNVKHDNLSASQP